VLRNIIFDWSGTLVDDLPAVWRASNHVFKNAGVAELSLEQFRAEFVLPPADFYRRHVGHVPPRQLEEWFHSRFEEVQDSVVELPHARTFLGFCRERALRTFLLSAAHPRHYATQAARTGFGDQLDHPCLGVWDKRARIGSLLTEHNLNPRETLFIGDMCHDIETARHGGVFSCAVLTGYNNLAQLRASQPDLIVEHLGELREILVRHGMELAPAIANGATRQPPSPYPLATVGALIFDEAGRVLMIQTHKWSDRWGIPGGKIQYGETSEAALRREILEETALEVADIRFVLVQDCISSREFYREAHFVLLNYTCRVIGPTDVRLNEEAQSFRWVTLAEALQLPLNEPTRILIEAVLKAKAVPGELKPS
jgi:phosphoglycolate phosphatase-like HAD superfamily hydrolase/ADP-ribose pyrophosphatase YjhB (NUDIX family)